jgi:hypothetical protein
LGKSADNDHQGEAMSNKRRIITKVAPVTPAQAGLVRRVGAWMVVRPEFGDLDSLAEGQIWNSAYELASLDGWVAPDTGDMDPQFVDEDGNEWYPLVRRVA